MVFWCTIGRHQSRWSKKLFTDSYDGILVEIDDLAGLVKALDLALKNDELRQKLIKNGKTTYEKNFSRDNVIATLIESYKEMIAHFKLQE